MSSTLLKKGGSSRWIIENFTSFDTVTIPAGYKISSILVKKTGTTAGNIKIGSTITPAVKEVITMTDITAPNAPGTLTITLRGGFAVAIPIAGTESVADLKALIIAQQYPGYIASSFAVDAIAWTATVGGVKVGATTINKGVTGITNTGPNEQVSGAAAVINDEIVASTALSITDGNISHFTVVADSFAVDTPIYVAVSSVATGDLIVSMQKMF